MKDTAFLNARLVSGNVLLFTIENYAKRSTDNLVAQRVIFMDGQVAMDIRPQPNFERYFKGQGHFGITDRELKREILSLIGRFREAYVEVDESSKFDNLVIKVSQNNYDVGTYKNGALSLVGEN